MFDHESGLPNFLGIVGSVQLFCNFVSFAYLKRTNKTANSNRKLHDRRANRFKMYIFRNIERPCKNAVPIPPFFPLRNNFKIPMLNSAVPCGASAQDFQKGIAKLLATADGSGTVEAFVNLFSCIAQMTLTKQLRLTII